jgi:hypothetical protein
MADFSVSLSGVLAWRPGTAELEQITIFDRKGTVVGTSGPPCPVSFLKLSPDEARLLVPAGRSWLLDVGQPGRLDLGADISWDFWSPDGTKFIGFDGEKALERAVSGSGEVRVLGNAEGPQDLSADGTQLLSMPLGLGHEIVSQELNPALGKDTKRVVVAANNGEAVYSPAFSPDGHWIVYVVRSGDVQSGGIFVQPFPGPGLRRQIADVWGPVQWRGDGKEILFERGGGIYSIKVDKAGDELRFSEPVLLFSGVRVPPGLIPIMRPLAVSRDGSRIFWPQATVQPGSDVIQVRTRAVN